MTKKKIVDTKEAKSPTEKEAPFWVLMGYSAVEWQGYCYTNKLGNPDYELSPYESDFSDFSS